MRRLTLPLLVVLLWLLPSRVIAEGESSISGVVWQDLNMDGVRQVDEPAIERHFVLLSGDRSAVTETAADGSYSFTDLPAGNYRVSVGAAGAQWVASYPAKILEGQLQVSISLAGSSAFRLDFGLVRVAVEAPPPGLPPRPGLPFLQGIAWIDGRRDTRPNVKASMDAQQCGFMPTLLFIPAEVGPGFYSLFFATAELVSGCGTPGGTITFTINGRPANETLTWPLDVRNLTLTTGPPFAVYNGDLNVPVRDGRAVIGQGKITATVNGTVCSEQFFSFGGYEISVLPESLRPGCATEGAVVEFFLDGVKARETAAWTPGFHRLDLTIPDVGQQSGPGAIRVPDTGDGGIIEAGPGTR